MASFVRLQVQLFGKGPSTLIARMEGEVLGDSDFSGACITALRLGVMAAGV